MDLRRLWALTKHLPPDAVVWRVLEAQPKNVMSVAEFVRHYRNTREEVK